MPTVEQNLREWGRDSEWMKQGDEWSSTWGGAEAQWFGAIFPRIQAFLPAGRRDSAGFRALDTLSQRPLRALDGGGHGGALHQLKA
jgi:hypothetical protein